MAPRFFRLDEHETTVRRELLAGLTTFAAMAYILAVNPAILSATGMDFTALIVATALASAAGSLFMALLTNYPIALAPGMGLNAFFTYTLCLGAGIPWQGALSLVFWSGVLFLGIALTPLRSLLAGAIPETLKVGIQAGIGLFIIVIGLSSSGLIVPHPETLITLGSFFEGGAPTPAALSFLGLLLAAILLIRRVPAAILLAIIAVTLLGLFVPAGESRVTPKPDAWLALPDSPAALWFQLDWWYPFRNFSSAWVLLLTLLFVDLFDTLGTLIAVTRQAGITNSSGQVSRLRGALVADASATTLGACVGTSPVTAYIESATGVQSGGRTGLTSLTVAACFLAAMLFHPLIAIIPAAATAPALILVGLLMMAGLQNLDWADPREALPGLLTAILIPLSYSIANGIALGCITYTLLMAGTGRPHRVHWLLGILSLLFAAKFAFGQPG